MVLFESPKFNKYIRYVVKLISYNVDHKLSHFRVPGECRMGASLNVFVAWLSRVLKNKRLINQAFLLGLSGGAGGNRNPQFFILIDYIFELSNL